MQTVITRDEARERIAANVRQLMDAQGMIPIELARLSDVAHSRISLLLRGELLPNPADLWNVAESLGTTLDGLMKPVTVKNSYKSTKKAVTAH